MISWIIICSFQDDRIFSVGQWSDRACNRNENLSNTSVTECECNHLTHFAILLSAAPPEYSHPVTLSLQIIDYVGVSVSLVAMSLTIITFLALKYAPCDFIIRIIFILCLGNYATCVTSFTSTSASTSV